MKTIYTNGLVFTGALPLVQAFAVENGVFVSAGSNEQVLSLQKDGDHVVDLCGRFVCPGFNDSHMHLLGYGGALSICRLDQHTGSLADVLTSLRAFISERTFAPGAWVRGRGWNQDYFSEGPVFPTRHDLDKVSTSLPICITRCCGHMLSVNTKALELLGITRDTPQVAGGHYDVDENGEPTGVFRDSAMMLVYPRLPAPTRSEIKDMIATACACCNAYGITSVQTDDLCTFENVDYHEVLAAYQELKSEGKLTVRVNEQSQFTTVDTLRAFLNEGYNTGWGDTSFRIGPLKMLGDGSLGARTAYLSGEYADAPGERGLAIFTQQEFDDMVSLAHASGMQVAIHAIGDGILDRILTAYERAFAAHPRADHRSGIVHAQITRPDQLQKMADLQLHAYAQHIFIDYDTAIVHARVGEQLASSSYAFKTMRGLGMHVSNGTDCPVENPNPMRGLQCAVTRAPLSGKLPAYRPDEALTVEEALICYTAESTHASFEEDIKGRIAPGMLADFAILSANPFATPADKLSSITCEETYLGGQKVH